MARPPVVDGMLYLSMKYNLKQILYSHGGEKKKNQQKYKYRTSGECNILEKADNIDS